MWVFNITNTNYTGRTAPIQIQNGSATADINDWSFGTDGNGKASFYYWIGSGPESVVGSTTIPLNTWTHIAATYDGSSAIKVYVNGVLDATGAKTGTPVTSTKNLIIGAGNGAYYNGYISNFRRVVGSVVYTGNFTPSTTPLTAITNTQILTCQSNRFIDNSTNAYPLTTGGTVSVQAFSPFVPTIEYDAAVVGGSGYFDGSGDFLTIAGTSTACALPGDFTIELWLYSVATTLYGSLISTVADVSTSNGLRISTGNNNNIIEVASALSGVITSSTAFKNNTWVHVALVRSGTTLTLYQNGVSVGSATNSQSFVSDTVYIGNLTGLGSPYYLNGYVSNLRVVKGTAVYTAAFTPPTAPLTAITNTSLLLSATNSGIYDSTAKNDLETVGNAQVSTTQAKWGTTSMYFDGTGDYLKPYYPSPTNGTTFSFGTGDFTIEWWMYPTSAPSNGMIMDGRGSGASGDMWLINWVNGVISWYAGATLISSSTVSTNTWTHVAICRSGTSTKMFLNGTQTGSTYTDTKNYTVGNGWPTIGASYNAVDFYTGYMDDLRVTKYARYTANFTAPTAAFPLQ
jgi:hypothetical protein